MSETIELKQLLTQKAKEIRRVLLDMETYIYDLINEGAEIRCMRCGYVFEAFEDTGCIVYSRHEDKLHILCVNCQKEVGWEKVSFVVVEE